MNDKPISLAKARKAKARVAARRQADANAIKFGQSKPLRNQQRQELNKTARALEAHKRVSPTDSEQS